MIEYTKNQLKYIESVGGGAQQSAIDIIGMLDESLQDIYEYAAWHADDDADSNASAVEDAVAHINGLIRQICRKCLDHGYEP